MSESLSRKVREKKRRSPARDEQPTPDPSGNHYQMPEAEAPRWPDPPRAEAYHGLAGDIVRCIEPCTEADPAALLVQTLVGYGNALGRTAYYAVEADQHHTNEFAVLVGQTSKARKGTSWGQVRGLLEKADPEWVAEHIQSGLSSGEGLVWAVRDAIMGRQPVKKDGKVIAHEEIETDPGVVNKRLLVYEAEFAQVLRQTERQGNTLSAIVRQAWDSGTLATLTKNDPTRATGAHISIVGHITADELRRYLSTTEVGNGFGNRFLWLCVRRSKLLPDGGRPDVATLERLAVRLAEAVEYGRLAEAMSRDNNAREVWHNVYATLSEGKPGLAGALLARGEAHVLRLATLYALLDLSVVIRRPHLEAAIALWEYVEASVRFIFGDSLGDPLADDILRLIRSAGTQGLSRTEMSNYLGRNQPSGRIGQALGLLLQHRLARFESVREGDAKKPTERWYAITKTKEEVR